MSGKSSQSKGRRAELELAGILQGYGYPVEVGKALNYGTEPDITGLPGVHAEVKRHERAQIWEWMAQAERDAQRFGDGMPAVFFRRNREPWRVVMNLTDWLSLYAHQKAAKPGEKRSGYQSSATGNHSEEG